ncbi:hypothetical protein SDC9_115470 [bioreactor metagenome]|uniref:HTH iclR-type domain-containing protein n=1 Tax=bioreactor metagenome TaxID=1076179 RepID=A0A645BTJ1_9ZZZZ
MKSLHKIFDILEYVVLRDGGKITPSEAAEFTGLNLATCTRIMGELVARGYLDKVSRREGYIPGPMCAALAMRRNSYTRLARAAKEPLRELSEFVGMPVNLSVVSGKRRIMIACCCGDPGWKPWDRFGFSLDAGGMATNPLLLAFGNERSVESGELRKKGYVNFYDEAAKLWIQGYAVRIPGYPVAAFGYGVPAGVDPEQALTLAAEAARKMEETLASHYQAY